MIITGFEIVRNLTDAYFSFFTDYILAAEQSNIIYGISDTD